MSLLITWNKSKTWHSPFFPCTTQHHQPKQKRMLCFGSLCSYDLKTPQQSSPFVIVYLAKELPTNKQVVYPKVKVRQEAYQEDDDGDVRDLGLKAFISLSLQGSTSPVVDKKNVSKPSIVKVPKCYVPPAPAPRVQITEDFGDCSLSSDSSGSTGPEKDDNTDENKRNIRASPIPRPRAVVSSPHNDPVIGNRNRTSDGSRSALKNGTVLQNRHAHCKVKSHEVADIPLDTRKSKEPGSYDKIVTVGRKKVQKGSEKSENVHRVWRF